MLTVFVQWNWPVEFVHFCTSRYIFLVQFLKIFKPFVRTFVSTKVDGLQRISDQCHCTKTVAKHSLFCVQITHVPSHLRAEGKQSQNKILRASTIQWCIDAKLQRSRTECRFALKQIFLFKQPEFRRYFALQISSWLKFMKNGSMSF